MREIRETMNKKKAERKKELLGRGPKKMRSNKLSGMLKKIFMANERKSEKVRDKMDFLDYIFIVGNIFIFAGLGLEYSWGKALWLTGTVNLLFSFVIILGRLVNGTPKRKP
jgi:uncharacterized protein (DUF983 family)